jgi:hypothetical protein
MDDMKLGVAERAKADRKAAENHTRAWRGDAKEDFGFVDGSMQWDEGDAQLLRDANRPPVTFNRVEPVIDVITGLELANRQEVRYIPRERGDVKVSEVATSAADWARDGCDAEDEESDAFRDMATCGMGWTETRMDYERDPDGEIVITRVDPLEMLWDTNATKKNLSDARWLGRMKDYTEAELKADFPDKHEEVTGLSSLWGDDLDSGTPHATIAGDQYGTERETGNKREKLIKVMEYQWYETVPAWRVHDPLKDELIQLEQDRFTRLKERLTEQGMDPEGLKAVKQRKRVYKRAFIAGDIVLEEGDSPCDDGFTYKCMTAKRDRNKNTWYGVVRGMKDPQRWANKWLSQIMHIINANAKGGVLAEQDAFINPRKAEEEWAKPDSITVLKKGALSQGKIKEKSPINFPSGLDKLMEFAVMSIRDVSGVNVDMLASREGSGTSGIQDYQNRQSGINILGTMFNSMRRYRKEQGRLLLEYIVKYISDGRLIRIVGEDGEKYVPLMKEEMAGKYDIIVDDAPSSPNQKDRTFSILSGLLPGLLQAGIPIPKEIIDYVPIPSALQEKWKETLDQSGGPSPEQIQEMQMVMQALKEENEKLKNDNSDKMAKIQADAVAKKEDLDHQIAMDAQELEHKRTMAEEEMRLKREMAEADAELDVLKAQAQFELKEMSELSKEADRQAEALRKDNESEEKREEKPQIVR